MLRLLVYRQAGYSALTDSNLCAIFNTEFPQYAITLKLFEEQTLKAQCCIFFLFNVPCHLIQKQAINNFRKCDIIDHTCGICSLGSLQPIGSLPYQSRDYRTEVASRIKWTYDSSRHITTSSICCIRVPMLCWIVNCTAHQDRRNRGVFKGALALLTPFLLAIVAKNYL